MRLLTYNYYVLIAILQLKTGEIVKRINFLRLPITPRGQF